MGAAFRGYHIGHQAKGLGHQRLHLEMQDQRALVVLACAELARQQCAIMWGLIRIGHLDDGFVGGIPAFGKVEASFFHPSGPVIRRDGVWCPEQGAIGGKVGNDGGFICDAVAQAGFADFKACGGGMGCIPIVPWAVLKRQKRAALQHPIADGRHQNAKRRAKP